MKLKNENIYIFRHSGSEPQTLQWIDKLRIAVLSQAARHSAALLQRQRHFPTRKKTNF